MNLTLFDTWQQESHILLQAVIALILGGALGWERETAGKWAGFRTHMFVCMAAAMFTALGLLLIEEAIDRYSVDAVRVDPVHIIVSIATCIAFLGAGTIIRDPDQEKARGLTTAASLLATASIGVAVATDRYIVAVGICILSLVVLRVLRWLETPRLEAAK